MTLMFARIRCLSGTLGRFNDRLFYADLIMVSDSPETIYRDPQIVLCDRSTGFYNKKTLIFSKDVVLIEYNAELPINTRRYFIIEKIGDKIGVAKIIDCSGIRWGLLKARVYGFSEPNGVAYPTDEVVECTPSLEIEEKILYNGDLILLQGKVRGSNNIHYIIRTLELLICNTWGVWG